MNSWTTSARLVSFISRSLGYEAVRRRGSHIRLKRQTETEVPVETIPDHKVRAKGTLSTILKHLFEATGKTIDDLIDMFR